MVEEEEEEGRREVWVSENGKNEKKRMLSISSIRRFLFLLNNGRLSASKFQS